MKLLQYITIIVFALASVFMGLSSYAQKKSDTLYLDTLKPETLICKWIIPGDSSISDAIGEKYFTFHYRSIEPKGRFPLQIYDSYGFAQYVFYDGYLIDQKYWYRGKLVDHTVYRNTLKHLNLSK